MISGDRVRSKIESASSMEEAAHTTFLNYFIFIPTKDLNLEIEVSSENI